VGSYYLCSREENGFFFGKQWGGCIGGDINIRKNISFGCSFSYDKIFKSCLQGSLSVVIPLKWESSVREKRNLRQVSIRHREIIPVQTQKNIQPFFSAKEETLESVNTIVMPAEIPEEPFAIESLFSDNLVITDSERRSFWNFWSAFDNTTTLD
jgi:hypothetical protein